MNKKIWLENSFKFLFPFFALVISYYLFNISDWIKPINDIEDDKVQWAFNLAFNTSLINIIYELIKAGIKPSIIYTVKVQDRKKQNSIILNYQEAEEVLTLRCEISVQKTKIRKKVKTKIRINYPKWITLELDNLNGIDSRAVTHIKKDKTVIFDSEYLFNENIENFESYEISLKVSARHIRNYKGEIQPKVEYDSKFKPFKVKSSTEAFKISIIEG